jgi:hypothetical protein
VIAAFAMAGTPSLGSNAQSLPPLYPDIGPGTHILDHNRLLSKATLNDPGWYQSELDWYKANIPFLDVPNKDIQAVYYYRWSVVKRNLRNTGGTATSAQSSFRRSAGETFSTASTTPPATISMKTAGCAISVT